MLLDGYVYQKLNVKKCIQCWTSCWKQFLFKHKGVTQSVRDLTASAQRKPRHTSIRMFP